jgi:hypothetical protein
VRPRPRPAFSGKSEDAARWTCAQMPPHYRCAAAVGFCLLPIIMNLQPPRVESLSISREEEDVQAHTPPPPLPPLPPPLDLDAKAFDVFSDAFFSPRPELERQRHKTLGPKTVSDVLNECWRNDDSQYAKLASTTGTNQDALRQFFRQPFDRILAHVGYLSLRRSDAFDDFRRLPKDASARTHAIVEAHNSPNSSRRSFPLCYVVGPTDSGAAATTFAVQHLKNFRNLEGLPSVLIYWELWTRHGHFDFGREDGRASSDLVGIFLELLSYRLQSTYRRAWSSRRHRLENLHVCLVMDGGESAEQNKFFANPDMVTRFARELEDTQFAASLMVAVVMRGPPPNAVKVGAANDAFYLFRVDG